MPKPTLPHYVQVFGTESQRERLAAGYNLPDAEVDEVVYRALWDAFGGVYYKRKRLTDEEVRHVAVMHRMAEPTDPVSYEMIEPADELTDVQWQLLKDIRKRAEAFGAEVVPFWVIANCGRKAWKKTYARVLLTLDDREFRIELALEPGKSA